MALQDRTVAFIGGGHITTTIIVDNLIRSRTLMPNQLMVSDPDPEKLEKLQAQYGLRTTGDNQEAVPAGDFVFINVLPQVVDRVIAEFGEDAFAPHQVVVSLAAGIPMHRYAPWGADLPVVRALPNPPSQIGCGIPALSMNARVTPEQAADIMALFGSLGEVVVVPERHLNTVTALSSPASVYLFFQALIDAGIRAGLDRGLSTRIVAQTIIGSMEVWRRRQVSPPDLIYEASTPGGISVESLFILEKYGFRAAINEAICEGAQKATRLGEDAPGR